jgi:hypothetical protein
MRPLFQVLANGVDITAHIRDRLDVLRVTDEAGVQADTAEITLDDRDGLVALPPTGAELTVALGYQETGLMPMGLYTVDEIELTGWPRRLLIRGKAADMRASLKSQKTRSWHEVTLGDIVRTIAGEHGLTPKIADALAGIRYSHVDQTNESDLHFLTRLAREHGAIAKPAAGNLAFVPRGEAKSASGRGLPAVSITAADLSDYRVTLADRGKYGSARAFWRDQAAARDVEVVVGSGEPVFTLRHPHPDAAQARAAAQAKLDALARGSATLSASMVGRPELGAEAKLTIVGVRSGVDGAWVITKAEHTLDANGLRTAIEAETPKEA